MKPTGVRGILVLVVALLVLNSSFAVADNGGGSTCAACTLLLQLLLNLFVVDNKRFDQIVINYCTTLPEPYANSCLLFASTLGDDLIELVGKDASSDQICHSLGVCTDETCRLFPNKTGIFPPITMPAGFNIRENNVWQWLSDVINEWTDQHIPPFDKDGDKFASLTETFRGRNWRGRDCDGISNQVYPGRQVNSFTDAVDQDCNGIHGRDNLGRSYESLLCSGTDRRGLIALGDSATAHFRVPEQYITASDINATTYDHFLYWGFNEFDWPHRSWATGHLNDTTGDCEGPMDSIYLNLYKRNRCNFRDFQNIGVNGARTSSMAPPGIINSMARNQTLDYPALVLYSLIGNDVCHPEPSLSAMTTVAEFEQNVLNALEYLNNTLPPGSNVLFVGLAEGEILWNTMWNRTHPIGCTYEDVYNFLNCLQISPCWGWLNSDPQVRAATGLRARELSLVYPKIVKNYSYKNFKMAYRPFPLPEAIKVWTGQGGQVYELIEPVDGFHPSQIANALLGQIIFDDLVKTLPDFVGQVNPNNQKIAELFGDQGGY